jgi:hypothetical protein
MSENNQFTPTIDPSKATVQELFQKVLFDRIQSGAVEQAITVRIDSMINSVADDVFKSYSDVGKALKEAMTKAVLPNIQEMGDLPNYNDFVLNRIKVAADNFNNERLAKVIDDELQAVFKEIPEQITFSWIVEKLVALANDAADYDDSIGEQVTLIIKDNKLLGKPGESLSIYMDINESKESYSCAFNMHLSKRKNGMFEILGLKVDNQKPGQALSIGRIYNLEKILFNVYAMKGEINMNNGLDPDDYDTTTAKACDY